MFFEEIVLKISLWFKKADLLAMRGVAVILKLKP